MERYTHKYDVVVAVDKDGTEHHSKGIAVTDITLAKEKLYQLENREEEIGCPLEVVFKALKQPIYSTHPKTNKLCCIICPTFYFGGNQWLIGCHSMEWNVEEMCCDSWDCFPKDYKKTWWLKKDKSE